MLLTPADADAAIVPARRDLRLTTIFFLVLSVIVAGLAVLVSPAESLHMFGLTSEAQATVIDSRKTGDGKRKIGPEYTVVVTWMDGDVSKIGKDVFHSHSRPPAVGSEITIQIAPFGSDITVEGAHNAMVSSIFLVSLFVLTLILAAAMQVLSRRWRRLPAHILSTQPQNIQLTSVEAPIRGKGIPIHFRTTGDVGPASTGSLRLRGRTDRTLPARGDLLQIWALKPGKLGPAILRRESDGLWWILSGKGPELRNPGQ